MKEYEERYVEMKVLYVTKRSQSRFIGKINIS
jgi:hypothetical protein